MAPKAKDARRIRTIFVDSQTYSAEFCILDSPKSSVIFALIITALWVIHHGTLPPRSRSIKQNRRASEDTRRFSFTHWVNENNGPRNMVCFELHKKANHNGLSSYSHFDIYMRLAPFS